LDSHHTIGQALLLIPWARGSQRSSSPCCT